jgi:hypothetical protein
VDHPLRAVKLGARLKQIERCPERTGAQRRTGLVIIATSPPGPKTFAADRPGLPVTIDKQIAKGVSAAV